MAPKNSSWNNSNKTDQKFDIYKQHLGYIWAIFSIT